MKHELFKLFVVKREDIDKEDGPLMSFLGDINTTPKSISTCDSPGDNRYYVVTIGYVQQRRSHDYHIVRKRVPVPIGSTLDDVETFVNQMAVSVSGVVCQDVLVEKDEVDMIFLTTK